MNILMVGHSGAGKTSFMAGMYKYLGEDKKGYGIHAVDSDQKKNLEKMARNLSKGIYPAGTDVQQMYKFAFTRCGEYVMPFNWMDYRGGILMSDNPDEEETQKFMKAISEADALVVFLDGEKMADKSMKWEMEYSILLSCIENSLDVKHKSWFPISFVITKCDLLPDDAKFYGLKYFESLFSQINDSKTVGAMLSECEINKDTYLSPFLTLAYCIYGGTPIYIKKREEAMEEAELRHRKHQPETFIGWIAAITEDVLSGGAKLIDNSWGWDTELDKAQYAKADIAKEKERLEKLQAISEELKEKILGWATEKIINLY